MKQNYFSILFLIALCCSVVAQKPNVPGDFPDPSIIKFGDYYYCSATSSNWAPGFPILKSKNLKNWEWVANIFPEKPEWVQNSFWAPELYIDNDKVYVYYTARKVNGGLCVAVASADQPEGPFVDHGPIVCEPVLGSIDGYAIRDENNKLYLTWKTDGNSKNEPTPIWAQEMNEERTALIGEKVELFRNELDWEGRLIEGQSIIKHNGYYYSFYSANGCCGKNCTYVTGIARSKRLLGPWEKDPNNPVMMNEENWKCQGHGSPIRVGDKNYYIYHGYNNDSSVFTGRQGLLREYKINDDDWITFLPNYIESDFDAKKADNPLHYFNDEFSGKQIKPSWNWAVYVQPELKQKNSKLTIKTKTKDTPIFLGQKIYSSAYVATASIHKKSSALTGIALIGDEKKNIRLVMQKDTLMLISQKNDTTITSARTVIPKRKKEVLLRVSVIDNSNAKFYYSLDGKKYSLINKEPLNINFLPPWDRAVRVGLYSKGKQKEKSVFNYFELKDNTDFF